MSTFTHPSQESRFARGCRRFATASNATPASVELHAVEAASNATIESSVGADGYQLIAPYGDHPHEVGMQHFDHASADAIVSRFKTAWDRLKAKLLPSASADIPVYFMHPDEPVFAAGANSDNTTVYGRFTDLQARMDGLYGKPVWTEAGNALRDQGKKLWFSPRWLMWTTSKADESPMHTPFKLLSVGIVERPNIYGAAANAVPTTTKITMIEAILAALGYTPEEIQAIKSGAAGAPTVDAIIEKIKAQKASTESDAKAVTDAKAEVVDAKKQADAANAALVAANASLAAERKARASDVIARAITEGRVQPTEKDAQVSALAGSKDFTVAANAVLARPPQLPQGGVSDGLGNRKGEMTVAANARADFETEVAALEAKGLSHDDAWRNAKTKHPDLYKRMSGAE